MLKILQSGGGGNNGTYDTLGFGLSIHEDDIDIELDGQVTLNNKMGLLTTVDDARESLENIFKNNIDKPNDP